VLSIIGIGGWLFANRFLVYPDPEDCSFQGILDNNNRYDNLPERVASLTTSSYSQCLKTISAIFYQLDVNNDELVDKCEQAKALRVLGNTDDYSRNFSGYYSKSRVKALCKNIVLDAFDDIYEPYPERDYTLSGLFASAMGVFPMNLFITIGDEIPKPDESS